MALAGAAAEVKEEKAEFDVILTAAGESKINIIKEIRAIAGCRTEGGERPRRWRAEAR
jgi:large subunit ribosomal protein L7/L12